MDITAIDNDRMPPALGPYSHAVRAGDFLFVAGQPGIDPELGAVPDGGFAAEALQGQPAFPSQRTNARAEIRLETVSGRMTAKHRLPD